MEEKSSKLKLGVKLYSLREISFECLNIFCHEVNYVLLLLL